MNKTYFGPKVYTLPETNMEPQKGPYKDYSPSKKGAIWVSMSVWGSVNRTYVGLFEALELYGVDNRL